MTVAELRLPEYLTSPPVAYLERGRRRLSWTVDEAGILYRNPYERFTVDVEEQVFLRPGSPLYVWTERVTSKSTWRREPFTRSAREQITADVLPYYAEQPGLFDLAWRESHRGKVDDRPTLTKVTESMAIVEWWAAKHRLELRYAAGIIELVDVHQDDERWPPREISVLVPETYQSGHYAPRVNVLAKLLDAHSAEDLPVGYLTVAGDVIPLPDLLD